MAAAMSASPAPKRLAVSTAPSSGRLISRARLAENGLATPLNYLCEVDVEAIARAQRRRQALEALELQRDREAALQEQLEAIVAEVHGPRIDEATFTRMAPEDVELARGVLESSLDTVESVFESDEEWIMEETPEIESEDYETELGRLQSEIADSRRLQQALRSYLAALGE
jgi:hypothetical protein